MLFSERLNVIHNFVEKKAPQGTFNVRMELNTAAGMKDFRQ